MSTLTPSRSLVTSSVLKESLVSARQGGNSRKSGAYVPVHEHFEGISNAASCHQRVFQYAASLIVGLGLLISQGAFAATTESYGYDTNGFRNSYTDRRGNTTTYLNNSRGLPETRTVAVGTLEERIITTQWHAEFRLPELVTEPGKQTDLEYYPNGQLHTRTIIDTATLESRTYTYTYITSGPAIGLIHTLDGPRTDVADIITFSYYSSDSPSGLYLAGDLWKVTNALGHVTETLEYDGNGRTQKIKDANGLITTLTYYPRGWLQSQTTGTRTTNYTYDNVGQLDTVTLPDGIGLDYDYDAAHRLIRIIDHLGNRVEYQLDAMGNREGEDAYDPNGVLQRTRTQVFDNLSRLSKTLGADGQIMAYTYDDNDNLDTSNSVLDGALDTNNNLIAGTDRINDSDVDSLDRLIKITDPDLGTTDYDYDERDNLTHVTDPNGNTTIYTYNGLGDLKALDSPDTGITTYEYDTAGNRSSQTDARGITTTFTYDALNRLDTVEYPDPSLNIFYLYDDTSGGNAGIGRLTSMSDASGSTSWTYSAYGEMTQESRTINTASGSTVLATDYDFNTVGQLDFITYPSGRVIDLNYTLGQLSDILVDGTTVLSGAHYEPFGPVSGWTWGNGNLHERLYDASGRLTDISLNGDLRNIGYNTVDNIDSLQDSNQDLSYGYDLLDRLEAFTVNSQTPALTLTDQGFQYDPNGNRTQLTDDGSVYASPVDPTSNRLQSVAGPTAKTYTYDNVGNITADGLHTYQYDQRNRLTGIDSGLAAYEFNGQGQRVRKDSASNTTLFVYDTGGQLIGEYDPTGEAIQETVYLGGIPVAVLKTALVDSIPTVDPITVEDGGTQHPPGWFIYDTTPAGADINSVYDDDRASRVIELTGTGTQNGFRFRNANNTNWGHTGYNQINWSHQLNSHMTLLVGITTDLGFAYVTYSATNNTPYINGTSIKYYRHFLGGDARNGQWQDFERNLEADLKALDPARSLLRVESVLARAADLRLDDITFSTAPAPITTEDAEDGTTEGWFIYDTTPAGAAITNVYDSTRGSQVISLTGTSTQNGFRFRNANNTNWGHTGYKQINWSHKATGGMTLLVGITTDLGFAYVTYGAADGTSYISGTSIKYYRHFLGVDARNGQWQDFERNLEADLKALDPARSLLKVESVLARAADLRLDDIVLSTPATGPMLTVEDGGTEHPPGWFIYDQTPAGADVTTAYDDERQSRVIELTGTSTQNGFRFRNANNTNWGYSDYDQINWSHQLTGGMTLLVGITTDLGFGYVSYSAANGTPYINGTSIKYYRHYLGVDARNGQWQDFERNLEADIQALDPARTLVKIEAFLVRAADARFDDIALSQSTQQVQGADIHYIHADHLNTPRVISDTTGSEVWRWDADPFGTTEANEDADGDGTEFNYNLRFPGQYYDTETKLHYNYFRDYDPATGRYVQSDPIGLGGGLNTYGYVQQNPLLWADFYGLEISGRLVRDFIRVTYLNILSLDPVDELRFSGAGLGVTYNWASIEFGGAYGRLIKCTETKCGETQREGYLVDTQYATNMRARVPLSMGITGKWWFRAITEGSFIIGENYDQIMAMIKARAAIKLIDPTSLCKSNRNWYSTIPWNPSVVADDAQP